MKPLYRIALIALAALSLAPVASANEPDRFDWRPFEFAAASYWGRPVDPSTCPDGVQVDRGALTGPLAIADLGGCRVTVDPAIDTYDDYVRCEVMVHEYGHLLGLLHTNVVTDVMYEEGPYWASIPQCDSYKTPTSLLAYEQRPANKVVKRCSKRRRGRCARWSRQIIRPYCEAYDVDHKVCESWAWDA